MTTSIDGLIVAASLAALFFGIQLVLYALLGYTLLTGGAFKGRIVVLSTASLLTVMSLSNMALSILYAEQSTESETEGGDLAGIDVTIKVFGRISLLNAQLIVIWRTWILWSASVAVRALLAFLAFASCATTIISIGLCFVASLSTATVASDALVMLVPLVGASAILYLGSEVASGGIDTRSNTTSSATKLTRALTGAASGVASTLTILVFLLVVHRVSTAGVPLRADRDDADTARDDHTLASSTTWRMSKKWKREKEKWDQSDLGSSDRATISTVDELPRYSRHMRDAKAFPVQELPQLSPPRPTRPLHVEKATRPRTEGALVEEQPRSWHVEYGRNRVDTAERRPHSSPSMRTVREDTIPSETRDTTPSGKQNTTPTGEQDIVEVSTAPTPHTVFAGWQTDRPLELRPFTLPPPTSRPPPESEADASESTYVHAPESLYSRAPDSDGAPSPQSSVESIADPPTAWRWRGPNPSSGTVYRDHAPYQHHDYAPYRHHALSRSAVSNLSSPSAYSVDSMALAIRDAADPLELDTGNNVRAMRPGLSSFIVLPTTINSQAGLFKILRHLPNLTDLRVEGTRFILPNQSSNETVNPSNSARLGGALAQLRIFQMKIVYGFSNSLQRQLLAWMLELPQFPTVEELGLTLHGSDSNLPRPLNAFMHRTMLSLKKWTINPGEYRNFLRTDLCSLDFSQFLVLHTVILVPIGLCTVRMQDHREDGRLLRFMLQVLAAPAFQTLIIHLKVDEDDSISDWETEQLDWAALDAALVEHPSLRWRASHSTCPRLSC
ncbi:hypothetical protein GGF50DRAFT_86393 [Schizophyllum commune]